MRSTPGSATDRSFGGSPSEIERVGQFITIEELFGLRNGNDLAYGFAMFNRGHARGLVLTSILGRGPETRLELPIR